VLSKHFDNFSKLGSNIKQKLIDLLLTVLTTRADPKLREFIHQTLLIEFGASKTQSGRLFYIHFSILACSSLSAEYISNTFLDTLLSLTEHKDKSTLIALNKAFHLLEHKLPVSH